MAEKKVKVRLLPLHSIGGFGEPGDVCWMTEAEAHYYQAEGYVEILADEPKPVSAKPTKIGEDHAIMKPKPKRQK